MEKQQKIVTMFDEISKNYDIANRVLSMGIDKSWRRNACNIAFTLYGKNEIPQILDVACGTGDMIYFWLESAKNNGIEIASIKGIDPSSGMLNVAKRKMPQIEFIQGSADMLPLQDNSVDIISISYGIRNVVNREEAIREFQRILKPNGLLVILEFTKNEKQGFADLIVDFYMNKILPILGGFVTKHKEAYTYLPNSIEEFLTTQKLAKELDNNGLKPITVKPFTMKISTLFIARKI